MYRYIYEQNLFNNETKFIQTVPFLLFIYLFIYLL